MRVLPRLNEVKYHIYIIPVCVSVHACVRVCVQIYVMYLGMHTTCTALFINRILMKNGFQIKLGILTRPSKYTNNFSHTSCRFAYDGLRFQRLTEPMVKGDDGQLQPTDWESALIEVASKVPSPHCSTVCVLVQHIFIV